MSDDDFDAGSCSSSSSSSDDDGARLAPEDGLCSDVLAALLEFQAGGGIFEEDDDDVVIFSKDTVCAAYRPEDTQVIANTLRRLQEKEGGCCEEPPVDDEDLTEEQERIVTPLQPPPFQDVESADGYYTALREDGVVRINSVLTAELCDACLRYINESLRVNNDGPGFGNVFERQNRFDMYLRPEGVIDEAIRSMIEPATPLGQLIHRQLLNGQDGAFHELSSLVADPGCLAQPIHPDSPFAQQAPLWTVFVALQDVTPDMGGTIFLPGTHTESCHDRLQFPNSARRFLQSSTCLYQRADLCAGDCAVMDARTFHYGSANRSGDERRVLLYFSIRNPAHTGTYPDCGSLFPDLDGVLTTGCYNGHEGLSG